MAKAAKPYQSCLIPHLEEILTLRLKRPPVSFPVIAGLLKEKYNLDVRRQTIEAFMKTRAKNKTSKTCRYATVIIKNNKSTNAKQQQPPAKAIREQQQPAQKLLAPEPLSPPEPPQPLVSQQQPAQKLLAPEPLSPPEPPPLVEIQPTKEELKPPVLDKTQPCDLELGRVIAEHGKFIFTDNAELKKQFDAWYEATGKTQKGRWTIAENKKTEYDKLLAERNLDTAPK